MQATKRNMVDDVEVDFPVELARNAEGPPLPQHVLQECAERLDERRQRQSIDIEEIQSWYRR